MERRGFLKVALGVVAGAAAFAAGVQAAPLMPAAACRRSAGFPPTLMLSPPSLNR